MPCDVCNIVMHRSAKTVIEYGSCFIKTHVLFARMQSECCCVIIVILHIALKSEASPEWCHLIMHRTIWLI